MDFFVTGAVLIIIGLLGGIYGTLSKIQQALMDLQDELKSHGQ